MHLLLLKSSEMHFLLSKNSQLSAGEGVRIDFFFSLSNYFLSQKGGIEQPVQGSSLDKAS